MSQWEQLEQAGAVFLPAAGNRRDSYVFNVQDYGRYWSSTASGTDHAYNVSFRSDILSLQGHTARNYGQAVRLVQDLKRYAITCATVDHAVITTDKTTATAGQTITITITPEAKYFTGTVTCTMTDGTAVAVNASTPKSNTYTFTMPAGNVTISATITRGFSVSADRFVEFAGGNLQYQPSTKTFRLAPHQYDTIGADNAQYLPKTSSSYSGWIDVFAWGTGDRPTVFGQTKTYPTFVDWGSNAIGTYAPNTWRTPTKDEWNYLLVKRPDAGDLMAFCTVNNVKGLIVLPDNWVTPVGLSFTPSVEKGLSYKTLEEGGEILEVYLDEDGDQKGYDHSTDNIYTLAEWSQLEAAGAVFLPADGMFSESHFDRGFGQYWSATPERTDEAYSSVFCGEVGNTMLVPFIYQDSRRYDMRTVRFVQDRNEYAITSVQKHAFFTVERTHANEGDVTTFTATPEMGYAITSVTITAADGSTITPTATATANQYTFTMPASNVTISATCELLIYTITCNTPTNGTLIADKATSTMGETVTITAKPDEGYALQLTVQQGTTRVTTTFLGSSTYTFTMPAGDVVVSAVFQKIRYSVSDNEDVAFSKGNLQYTQSTKTWSFAEHQYDYIGAGNVENGALADKIDLFGWSADNTTAPWGISTSTNKSDYSGDFVDWGENAIGQDAANTWRTLSGEEWGYLFESRANASSLYGFATVDGKKGLILLPDDWVLPSGISFHAGKANLGNNVYTLLQWEEMELAGAVFLPGASRRKGTDYDVQGYNVYWSSTACNANNENDPYNANFVLFHSNNGNQVEPRYCDIRYYGRSVRLVKDL